MKRAKKSDVAEANRPQFLENCKLNLQLKEQELQQYRKMVSNGVVYSFHREKSLLNDIENYKTKIQDLESKEKKGE